MDNLHKGDELLGVGHDKAAAYAADIGVLGVLRALMRLRGLVLLPFLARTLGPAAFGVWTQSLVAIDIGSSIIGLQLHQAVVRFVAGAEDREQQREIFFPVLFITIALGFLVSCLTLLLPKPISSVILGDISYVDIARWLGLWIAANAISRVGLQLLRGLHRVKLYGFLSTSITLVQLVTVVVVLLYSNELSMAIFTAIVVEIIGALLILTICFAEVGVGLSRWKRLRAILKFSLPLVPGYIADLLLSFSDRLIIAAMLGSEAIGIYAAAYTLARLMREIFVPINTAMLPVVSRAWDRGDHDQARWVLSSTMRYFLLVAIPAWVGISLVGADLLDILATSTVGRPTAQLIPFIGLGLLVSSLQQVYTIVMQLTERTSALAATKLIIAFFYIVLVFYAVPRWGLLGGAIVTAIGYVLDLSSSALLAARHGRIFPDLGNIVKQGIAAALMIPAVLLISAPGIPGILLKVMMGLAVYLVSLILIGGIGRRELQFLKSIVTRHESRA